ncbi:hypothetical protein [Shewanella algae]|uniref:hypothetical protein n=1 Tax=Shewanella algae TaxID=38313 RepID=UPI0005CDB584|nr:hypothetical protein [Shewanella algae]
MRTVAILLFLVFFVNPCMAKRYWPPQTLEVWNLTLNNQVAYISSPQFAGHCSYLRGQINMDGTEFNRALYAYALSAKAKGKKLRYVIDNEQVNCVITGLEEVD